MRRLLVAFALPLACGAQLLAAAQVRRPDDSLRLAAEVVGSDLCAGQGGVDFLHMRVRLRYTNTGKRRLILYRGNNLFFQAVVSPGAGAQGGPPPRRELRTTSAVFLTREAERLERDSPGKDFVTLAPGAGRAAEVTVSLPVARDPAHASPGAIAPGEHFLRLVVSTWYESKQLGERLRERWRRGGHLWTDALVTPPVRFEAGGAAAARDCAATPAGKAR